MNSEFKEITSCLYGGKGLFSGKNNPYKSHVVQCNSSNKCPLYGNNQCLMAERLRLKKCIFGKVVNEYGTSYRAKSYYDLKSKTTARESYGKLKSANVKFTYINGYYFIDTTYCSFWKNNETNTYQIRSLYDFPFNGWDSDIEKKKWSYCKEYHFFEEQELTVGLLKDILDFKPQAAFGGVIDSYQREIIPQMKAEILKFAPKLAESIGIKSVNYVGMKGQLNTLKSPLDFEVRGLKYHWDGKYVTTTERDVVDSFKISSTWTGAIGEPIETYVRFKPFDELYIEIEDNSWVKQDSVVKSK